MKVVPLVLVAVMWNRCGIKPGEYQTYRIAQGEVEMSDDCFAPDGEDPNTADDASTFFVPVTIALFSTGNGEFFLDTDDLLIQGVKEEGIFAFEGVETDVNYFGPDDASTTTSTTTVAVDVDLDGDAVSGTWSVASVVVCDGPDCGGTTDTSCTQSSPFVGSRIRGAEVERPL